MIVITYRNFTRPRHISCCTSYHLSSKCWGFSMFCPVRLFTHTRSSALRVSRFTQTTLYTSIVVSSPKHFPKVSQGHRIYQVSAPCDFHYQ
uniref:Uncharacterized protein MANES_12G013000 n=1 Tax=Rhizophora mucronata TaxID=61149 RepID=A0A2P2J691_RHIMU